MTFLLIGVIVIMGAVFIYDNFSRTNSFPPQMLLSEEEWDFGLVKPD